MALIPSFVSLFNEFGSKMIYSNCLAVRVYNIIRSTISQLIK